MARTLVFFQYNNGTIGKIIGYRENVTNSLDKFTPAPPPNLFGELLGSSERVIDSTGKIYELKEFVDFIGEDKMMEGYKVEVYENNNNSNSDDDDMLISTTSISSQHDYQGDPLHN